MKQLVLKPGKEKAIRNKHHWIFSGAVAELSDVSILPDGDCAKVYSSRGEVLGSAYINRASSIIGRMITFDETPPLRAIEECLVEALRMRCRFFSDEKTNAYRLVNGEGDCLPGLIVDKYGDVIVIQISTLGMERLKGVVVDLLRHLLNPVCIYEKSNLPSRREEKLNPSEGVLFGVMPMELLIRENGHTFIINVVDGQKTGFFLDHREMRRWVGEHSKGKRVLNCFCYTGGFSVYARAGECIAVDSVDISKQAIELARMNMAANGWSVDDGASKFICADVFDFLREEELDYDLVILDPPAFAKKKKDIISACRGYKDINRVAMQKMPIGSVLLTCSCSYHVSEELFQKVIFQAAAEAGRDVKIIGRHQLGIDHPINIYHPEGDYLKSLILYL